jgi:hypothetical protein
MTSSLHRARHLLRTRLCEYPRLYLPLARRRYPGPSPAVIGPRTELVIDGYTRSASTFAVYALQLAQPAPVRLAHHLHAPAQLVEAARRGLPALLLIREPRDAILSQLVQEPNVAMADALTAYARFHRRLLPYRDRLEVADFEQVTNDFGSVIARLNQHFGTAFTEFEHSDAAVGECLELMALRDTLSPILLGFESGSVGQLEMRRERRALTQGRASTAQHAWVPSAARAERKNALLEQWQAAEHSAGRAKAMLMYRTFLGYSVEARA